MTTPRTSLDSSSSTSHFADPLRVGIVGAGWMGVTHGRAWAANAPRARIVAVADASQPRAQSLSDEATSGKARTYAGLDSLLKEADVDAIDICLPHHLHKDAILAAARAGKHVLCEKPLCLTLDEAKAIRDGLRETGVTFMAAHNNLFAPALVEARRRLDAGELGPLYFVRSTESGRNVGYKTGQPPIDLAPGESSWSWRRDPAKSGGGEVIDTGWHGMYRLLALARSRPVEVTAMLGDYFIHQSGVEDTGAVLLRFQDGSIGFLLTSWAFGELPGAFRFQAASENGGLGGTATKLQIALHDAAPAEQTFENANTFAAEVTHFLDVLQRGATGLATWDHAARTLQCILAAYRAAADHRTIHLPEDPTEL